MKIIIIAVGKEKDFSGHELVAEYTTRTGRYVPIEWKYIPASDIQGEGLQIIKTLEKNGSGSHVVMLDEKGKEFSSSISSPDTRRANISRLQHHKRREISSRVIKSALERSTVCENTVFKAKPWAAKSSARKHPYRWACAKK